MGRRRKAQLGMVPGNGSAPYGYRYAYRVGANGKPVVYGFEIDPVTSQVVIRIFRDLRTRSTLVIAEELNRDGIPSPNGRTWRHKAIHRIAINPAYAGTLVYGQNGRRVTPDDTVGIPVPEPPLVTRAEWDEVQQAMARRYFTRRGRKPVDQDPYVLRGRLTCGHCRAVLQTYNNRGTRYYRCACHTPSKARMLGKPLCDLPDLYAKDLEEELWRALGATLLDRDYLDAGLDAARTKRDDADRLRLDRLATIDGEITRQRQRLDTLAHRITDAGDGEVFAALMRQAKEIEGLIARFAAERADLAALQSNGLGPDDVQAIEAFAEEIRAGLDLATLADRRRLCDLLQIAGAAYADPDGTDPESVALGRRHRYRLEWRCAIPLRYSASRLRKAVMQWMPPPALISSEMSTVWTVTPAAS